MKITAYNQHDVGSFSESPGLVRSYHRTRRDRANVVMQSSGARNLRRPAAGKNQIPRRARNDKAALGMTSVEVLANNKHSQERAFLCASVVRVP